LGQNHRQDRIMIFESFAFPHSLLSPTRVGQNNPGFRMILSRP
jgi:hypothetical protein